MEFVKIILTVEASSLLSPRGKPGSRNADGKEWLQLFLPCNLLNFSMSFCPDPHFYRNLKFQGLEKTHFIIRLRHVM